MTLRKMSVILAGPSALSRLWAIVRGDFMCASDLTGCLLAAFFLFGLAAIICLIVGELRADKKLYGSK
jgi:hypothetical protein